jgi:uncharacterized protein
MFWRAAHDGVSVEVKVQPRSRCPGLHGPVPDTEGVRLRIAVREPAEDGRANRAVCAALAEAIGVSMSAVAITAGAAARRKTLHVTGEPATIAARLASL